MRLNSGEFSYLRVIVALLLCAGCQQEFMADQPRLEPLEASAFYRDGNGMASRPLVPGTVPRTGRAEDYDYDEHLETGRVDGELARELPERLQGEDLRTLLVRGQERFQIFCVPCHDPLGTGNGMVPQRGFPFPPSYHIPRLREAPLGHFFVVMTDGLGRMPPYDSQIPVEDRWRIAAYLRALQLSQHAPVDQLSSEERERLDGK